jgi:NAD-dependent histone deacetylase SIR2
MSSKHVTTFRKGEAPACPNCNDIAETRQALGKRALSIGTLRPDVVLYNENHSGGMNLFINGVVFKGKLLKVGHEM